MKIHERVIQATRKAKEYNATLKVMRLLEAEFHALLDELKWQYNPANNYIVLVGDTMITKRK